MLFSKTLAPLRYPDGPQKSKEILVELTEYGKIADKYIKQLNDFYENISIDDYVIMPNHIHLLINVRENGPSGTPVPTELVCVKKSMQNSVISRFVSTFKRFSNKEYGKNIWQTRSFDHIIRDNKDYEFHIKYIHENPLKWYFNIFPSHSPKNFTKLLQKGGEIVFLME